MMDHDSLIQLLPQLLNKVPSKVVPDAAKAAGESANWYEEQVCSDQASTQSQSDSEQYSETSSDQEDETGRRDQDTKHEGRISPKPVDLDEIEKFLECISKPNTPRQASGPSNGMANILKEVDELGRRTLSSGSLLGGGRPPPSPRQPIEPHSPAAGSPVTVAVSESALLRDRDAGRRVRFSWAQRVNSGDQSAPLAPHNGDRGKLSRSEPALGYTLQSLMSDEKKRYLNLTADMILLKQSSLENEIQMKTEWEEHLRALMAENASLKHEVEKLRKRPPPAAVHGSLSDRTRLNSLEHRVGEQDRLLDGFNAENARLYRELKQLKTERSDLETVVEDLQGEQRLLRARLQTAERTPALGPPTTDQQQEQQLRRRELQLERRWQEVQRAGHEVARLHDLVSERLVSPCVRCRSRGDAGGSGPCRDERSARPLTVSVSCQTAVPSAPVESPTRSPEHVAAAATAELRSLRAALVQSEQRQHQEAQTAAVREADLRRACEAKMRAAEGRLRRLQSSSPTRPDPELMAALRRSRAQLADKERALTQSRRQLEKSQRTVTGLQREREKLLVTIAARSPEQKVDRSRSQITSPNRSHYSSPVRRTSAASTVTLHGCGGVDVALLSELQTAIAAVEEENVLLKDQLGQMKVSRDEEVSRRDSEIAALRTENAEVRAQLGTSPSTPVSARGSDEEEALLSARKDSLMLEMGSHMEAQEQVIVHLRETIRRFQEQTRLITELDEENRSLRGAIGTLHRRTGSQTGHNARPKPR